MLNTVKMWLKSWEKMHWINKQKSRTNSSFFRKIQINHKKLASSIFLGNVFRIEISYEFYFTSSIDKQSEYLLEID